MHSSKIILGLWFLLLSLSNIVGCKWVYCIKRKNNGEIDHYKAYLMAKGFNQQEGIDFRETFSPCNTLIQVCQ